MAVLQTALTAKLNKRTTVYTSGQTFKGTITDDGSAGGADSIVISQLNDGSGSVTVPKSQITGLSVQEGF